MTMETPGPSQSYEATQNEVAQVGHFRLRNVHRNPQAQHHSSPHTQGQLVFVLLKYWMVGQPTSRLDWMGNIFKKTSFNVVFQDYPLLIYHFAMEISVFTGKPSNQVVRLNCRRVNRKHMTKIPSMTLKPVGKTHPHPIEIPKAHWNPIKPLLKPYPNSLLHTWTQPPTEAPFQLHILPMKTMAQGVLDPRDDGIRLLRWWHRCGRGAPEAADAVGVRRRTRRPGDHGLWPKESFIVLICFDGFSS